MIAKQLVAEIQKLKDWEQLKVFVSLDIDDPNLYMAKSVGVIGDFGVEITA